MRGIYIHIPFCIQKCRYCAFNSFSGMENIMEDYTSAVIAEIKSYERISADTLYLGGGTPTLLPRYLLEKIICEALDHFCFEKDSEVTIEANPQTVTLASLRALRGSGVNRISLGVQSLSDSELAALGRVHSKRDALSALSAIQSAGFTNFSVDTMTALPYQSMESLYETVSGLLLFNPPHFSAYSLSIDEGTYFYENPPSGLPDEDTERKFYWFLADTLKNAGYEHYEISNFALPHFSSRHNTKYWLGEEYIGLGAGAHSYFRGERFEKPSDPKEYIKNPFGKLNITFIDEKEKQKEYYMLGLRLLCGVPEVYHENIEPLIKNGLISRSGGKILLTKRGIDLANYVMEQLL